MPNVLEIVELCGYKEFSRIGLQIEFANALCPFAFICKNEVDLFHSYSFCSLALSFGSVNS